MADTYNGRVLKLAASGAVTPVSVAPYNFKSPSGLTVDGSGNLYIADQELGTVFKVTPSGGVSQISSSISLSSPRGMAFDASGNLYIANFSGNSIVKVTPEGTGSVLPYTVVSPNAVAVDAAGDVYVIEAGFANDLLEFSGSTVSKIGFFSNGVVGVTIDASGNLYVSFDNAPVSKLDRFDGPSLTFNTATTVGSPDTADGPQGAGISNSGNLPLTTLPNPNVATPISSASFALDQASTCLGLINSSTSLAPGGTCLIGFDFNPATAGGNSGTATFSDNSLNQSPAVQTIQLQGTGNAVVAPPPVATKLVISGLASTLTAGGNLGSPTASVEDSNGNVVTLSAVMVMMTMTGPDNFSKTVTAARSTALPRLIPAASRLPQPVPTPSRSQVSI